MKKKVIIVISVIIGITALVAGALFLSDNNVSIPIGGEKVKAPGNEAAITALTTAPTTEETGLPSDMSGVWLDLDSDIVSTGSDAQVLYSEIVADFDYFTNFKANTLIIRPDTTGRTQGFINADGSSFDALSTILGTAKTKDYFTVLAADDSLLTDNGSFTTGNILRLLNSYQFDAVLISSSALNSGDGLATYLTAVKTDIGTKYPSVFIGLEVFSLNFSLQSFVNEQAAVASGNTDFILINADCQTTDANSFMTVMNGWKQVADTNPGVNFYVKHRNDKVYSGKDGWNDYLEIVYQYKSLWDYPVFKGSVYYKLSQIKARRACSQMLSAMIYDGATKDFEVQQMTINPTENTVLFAGKYDTDRGLFCNSSAVNCNAGVFSHTYKLNAGNNLFHFENAGQYYNYRIYNNTKLLLNPSFTLNKDKTVSFNAVCLAGSRAYAIIGGETLEMTCTNQVGEGLYAYTVTADTSGKNWSEAQADIVCLYGELSETSALGTVVFTDSSEAVQDNSYKPTVTPFTDNGLGTALMCQIYYDATEQLGILNSYDTYDPDKSTLLAGTLDYVNQINLTDDGNIRYELRSGVAVYAENCMLINNAFVMPQNNISVYAVDDSKSNVTDILFNYDWLSPVTVTTAPNSYKKGYMSFSFNIDSFAAEYVDVKFAYTDTVSGTQLLTFGENCVFSSAEVIKGADNESSVLRLYLKQPGKFFGFSIGLNEDNRLCLSVRKHSDNSIQGKVVMLDPGHGGLSMTGTAISSESISEAEVTMSVAEKTRQILTSMGATVVLTRNTETSLTLNDRVKICEEQQPDIFVSLHCDGTDNKAEAGTHTFYYRPYSQPLANAIHTELVHHYTTYIYTDADKNMDIVNKKIKYYPYFVTRVDTCPSVLVELGFMSNAVESSVLIDENCQYWLADAVANGIVNYFRDN